MLLTVMPTREDICYAYINALRILPPIIGGMERHVQTLSRELVRRGHRVAVVTLQQEGLSSLEDDEGVSVLASLDGTLC